MKTTASFKPAEVSDLSAMASVLQTPSNPSSAGCHHSATGFLKQREQSYKQTIIQYCDGGLCC